MILPENAFCRSASERVTKYLSIRRVQLLISGFFNFSELIFRYYNSLKTGTNDFKDLEKVAHRVKYRFRIENFSGKSVHSVYQDFHAEVFSKNLTAVIATATGEEIIQKSEVLKYDRRINFAQALPKMKDTIILLFNRSPEDISFAISKIQKIFIQTAEAVRPNRKFPRSHRVKQKCSFMVLPLPGNDLKDVCSAGYQKCNVIV